MPVFDSPFQVKMGAAVTKVLPKPLVDAASLNEHGGYSWSGTLKQGGWAIPITYQFQNKYPATAELPTALIDAREELGWPNEAFVHDEPDHVLLCCEGFCHAPLVELHSEPMLCSLDKHEGALRVLLFLPFSLPRWPSPEEHFVLSPKGQEVNLDCLVLGEEKINKILIGNHRRTIRLGPLWEQLGHDAAGHHRKGPPRREGRIHYGLSGLVRMQPHDDATLADLLSQLPIQRRWGEFSLHVSYSVFFLQMPFCLAQPEWHRVYHDALCGAHGSQFYAEVSFPPQRHQK